MDKALTDLAVVAEMLRVERARVWDGIKAFEKFLIDQAGELGFVAQSDMVILEEYFDQEDEQVGHVEGRLFFNGKRLVLFSENVPENSSDPEKHFLRDLSVQWLKRIGEPEILHSVAKDLAVKIKADVEHTRKIAENLARYLTVQIAKTDEDISAELSDDQALLHLWLECHSTRRTKPQDSVRSGALLLESTFKRCLKKLGHSGYSDYNMGHSIGALNSIFHDRGFQETYTGQMLAAAVKMCGSIGTTRNKKANVHGHDEDFVPPTEDLALLMSHMSGSISVYVRKQVELVLESDKNQ
ncbi:hypothetical protein HX823_19335 [Pseudomonas sp. P7759]|uniref:hypothetical protein n=1 Tax=Pseudomonas sp. P7759 TaxID=2738831 RepID=UPI00159FF6AF|nr:hypothetical protein [Pseudomonas sp. P7759]NWC76235.1 hypothetical protein [Pseudomonas sp. P7759]